MRTDFSIHCHELWHSCDSFARLPDARRAWLLPPRRRARLCWRSPWPSRGRCSPALATHLTGDPGGDTGVYVWNQWVFQHGAMVEQPQPPDHRAHLLAVAAAGRPHAAQLHRVPQPAGLAAHRLARPGGDVQRGLPAAVVLTAWMTFVLARRVTEGATVEAWLAGLAFAWSPLTGRAHAPATSAWSRPRRWPAFLWCLHRVDRSERLRDCRAGRPCSGVGGLLRRLLRRLLPDDRRHLRRIAAAPCSNWRPAGRTAWAVDARPVSSCWPAASSSGWPSAAAADFDLFGMPRQRARAVHADPAAHGAGASRACWSTCDPVIGRALAARPAIASRRSWPAVLAGAVRLSPVLYGASVQRARRLLGRRRRSTGAAVPRGVDLLAFVTPNPSHPLMVWLLRRRRSWPRPTRLRRVHGGVSLVALAVIAVAVWRPAPRAGLADADAIFAALALGPFVHVAGINTYIPGPVGAAALRAGRSAWRACRRDSRSSPRWPLSVLFALAAGAPGPALAARAAALLAGRGAALLLASSCGRRRDRSIPRHPAGLRHRAR